MTPVNKNKYLNFVNSLSYLRDKVNKKDKKYFDDATALYVDRKIEKKTTVYKIIDLLASKRDNKIEQAKLLLKKYHTYQPSVGIKKKDVKLSQPKNTVFHIEAVITCEYKITNKKNNQKHKYINDYSESKIISATTLTEAKQIYSDEIHFNYNIEDSWYVQTVKNIKFKSIYINNDQQSSTLVASERMYFASVKNLNYDYVKECKDFLDTTNNMCVIHNIVGYLGINKDRLIEKVKSFYNKNWSETDGIDSNCVQYLAQYFDFSMYAFDVTNHVFIKHVSKSRNLKTLAYFSINKHMYLITDKALIKSMSERSKEINDKINTSMFQNEYEIKNIYSMFPIVYVDDLNMNDVQNFESSIFLFSRLNGRTNLNDELINFISTFNLIPAQYKIKSIGHNINEFSVEMNENSYYFVCDPNDSKINVDSKMVKKLCKKFDIEFKNQSFVNMITEYKNKFFDMKNNRHNFSESERISIFSKLKKICNVCEDDDLEMCDYHIDHIRPLANGGTNDMTNLQILCKSCHQEKCENEIENGIYQNISDTQSSFNNQTKEIVESSLCKSWAFIEHLDISEIDLNRINKNIENDDVGQDLLYTIEESDDDSCLCDPYLDICDHKNKKQIVNNDNKIEQEQEIIDNKFYNLDVHHIDINKCRTEILYSSKFDYPVFSVMDSIVEYKNQTQPGYYYVETTNYLPMRGNGWYTYPTIKFCLKNKIIEHANIKYVILSSFTLKHDYFNEFIDSCRSGSLKKYGLDKLAINSMIGNFNVNLNKNVHTRTIAIVKNNCDAYQHFFKNQANQPFMKTFKINNETYYHIYENIKRTNMETESPIYKQIVEIEAIKLYKLKSLIESNRGIVLDLNTDSCSCVFPETNKLPFDLIDGINIDGYFYDAECTKPMYKIENKNRLKYEKCKQLIRRDKFNYTCDEWNVIFENDIKPDNGDVMDQQIKNIEIKSNDLHMINDKIQSKINNNDSVDETQSLINESRQIKKEIDDFKCETTIKTTFDKLVDKILTIKNVFINGPPGAGKSTIVKLVQLKLREQNIKYLSATPTNVASLIIPECTTLHKLKSKLTKQSYLKKNNVKYIFIDEISMVHEIFYKFMLSIKNISPEINFIISGDFNQLEAVCDRFDGNYENSRALYELVNGNRINLTQCKRSDSDLYNIFTNLKTCKKSMFKSNQENFNLCYTNEKRKEINKKLMTKYQTNESIKVSRNFWNENSQDMILSVGMPIISFKNCKKMNIVNNETYTIDKIEDNTVYFSNSRVQNLSVKKSIFVNYFYPAYAITIHKSQSQTYDFPFTIHEWERLNDRLKYVALSRATKKNFVNII